MQNGLYINTGTEWKISSTLVDGPVLRNITVTDGLVFKLTEDDINKAPYIKLVFEPQHAETQTVYDQSPVDLSQVTMTVTGNPTTLNMGTGTSNLIGTSNLNGGYIQITPQSDPGMYGINNNTEDIQLGRALEHIGSIFNNWAIGKRIIPDMTSIAFYDIAKNVLAIDTDKVDGNYAFFDRSFGRFSKLMEYGIIPRPETYPYLQDKPGHVIPVYDLDLVGYIYKAGDLLFVLLDYRTGNLFTMGFVMPYSDPKYNIECEQQMFELLKSFHTYVNNKARVVAEIPTQRVVYR